MSQDDENFESNFGGMTMELQPSTNRKNVNKIEDEKRQDRSHSHRAFSFIRLVKTEPKVAAEGRDVGKGGEVR